MFVDYVPLLLVIAAIALLAGYLLQRGKIDRLQRENTRLETELELERKSSIERNEADAAMTQQLKDTFNAMASSALKDNN